MFSVNEMFVSIQGEGPAVGHPSLFIRFSGCNLSCDFCDTDFSEKTVFPTEEALYAAAVTEMRRYYLDNLSINFDEAKVKPTVIFTGGEPLLQLTQKLARFFTEGRYYTALETNGSSQLESAAVERLLGFIDYVTVSPKSLDLSRTVMFRANCIKLVYGGVSFREGAVEQLFGLLHTPRRPEAVLQPMTRPVEETGLYLRDCKMAVLEAVRLSAISGVPWRVIPQTHVLMGLR